MGGAFAVVAAEVRSLAQRSATAAKEIKALIGTSTETVKEGASLVSNAGATMGEIVSSVRRVNEILDEISHALIKDEMVKLSSFGSFQVRAKGKRIGRNPKTGEEVPIMPRRVLVFRASHSLKDQINSGLGETGEGEAPEPGGQGAAGLR